MEGIRIKIDGKEIEAHEGDFISGAARDNGVFIPTLCECPGVRPTGSCRVCTVKAGGRLTSACTTEVGHGMEIENDTDELNEMRLALIEMLFVEGNHMCPGCEKSGDCRLQALAYRYRMTAPRFPYLFPERHLDASYPHMILEHNRCIQCRRCVEGVYTSKGDRLFALSNRGQEIHITVCPTAKSDITPGLARKAQEICPVGAIMAKEPLDESPFGERKYDKKSIGSDLDKTQD